MYHAFFAQASELETSLLEQEVSSLIGAVTKVQGLLIDKENEMTAQIFLANVSRALSEQVKQAHTALGVAQGALQRCQTSLAMDEDPSGMLLDAVKFKGFASTMTIKWAVYTLLAGKQSPKSMDAMRRIHTDFLQVDDAKNKFPQLMLDLAVKFLGIDGEPAQPQGGGGGGAAAKRARGGDGNVGASKKGRGGAARGRAGGRGSRGGGRRGAGADENEVMDEDVDENEDIFEEEGEEVEAAPPAKVSKRTKAE